MSLALKRFIGFFNDTPEYNKFAQGIKPTQITKDMVEAFTEEKDTEDLVVRKGWGCESCI